MDLVYLWVDEFRSFEKIGFNLTGEFRFEIEEVKRGKDVHEYSLVISRNGDYCNIFPDSIRGVTGIIGKNGTGKSTLLHCLKILFGSPSLLDSSAIMCFYERGKETIHTFYYKNGNFRLQPLNVSVSKRNLKDNTFKLEKGRPYSVTREFISIELGDVPSKIIGGVGPEFLENIHCAYLSNAFDQSQEELFHGIQNLSANSIIDSLISQQVEQRIKNVNASENEELYLSEEMLFPSNFHQFRRIQLDQWMRFLTFINSMNQEVPDFVPRNVNIQFNFLMFDERSRTSIPLTISSEILKSVFLDIDKNYSEDPQTRFLLQTYFCTILYFTKDIPYYGTDKRGIHINNQVKSIVESHPRDLPKALKEVIRLLVKNSNSDILSQKLKLIEDDKIIRILDSIDFEYAETSNLSKYQFPITPQLLDLLKTIFDLNYGEAEHFMDFSFGHGLSTGEETFLTNCSKLFQVRTEARGGKIMLLIDEGDLYYHPEWQRKYIADLFSIMELLFEKGQVQLVLTTHSPFIISDLPKQNLLFLQKDSQGKTTIMSRENHTETFGANIHELYTDSFFLEDGLMGQFAIDTLNKLFEDIKNKKSITREYYYAQLQNQINLVGEPFLKTKMIEMVAEKASEELLLDIIEDHRMEMLNNIRRRRQND